MWSTGSETKTWIWPAWGSIVRMRSTPAATSMSAISFAVMGSRGADFLSWREEGYQGMTAVILLADGSLAAWIIIMSSIRWSLVFAPWHDWTRKTSAPRMDSQ